MVRAHFLETAAFHDAVCSSPGLCLVPFARSLTTAPPRRTLVALSQNHRSPLPRYLKLPLPYRCHPDPCPHTALPSSHAALGRLINRTRIHSFREKLEALYPCALTPRLNPCHRLSYVTVASAAPVHFCLPRDIPSDRARTFPSNEFAWPLRWLLGLETFFARSYPITSYCIGPATTYHASIAYVWEL